MIEKAYPGNPQLPEETKFRVENAFRQALGLFMEGKMEDSAVGCDFILKMDPQFAPARMLMEKSKNPLANVDLAPVLEMYKEAQPVNVEDFLIQAIEAFNARDYAKTTDILGKILAFDPGNAEAKDIFARAQEKLEAMPFVHQFLSKGRRLLNEDDLEEALKQVNKGLALDDNNPNLLALKDEIENKRGAGPAHAPAPKGQAPPVMDFGGELEPVPMPEPAQAPFAPGSDAPFQVQPAPQPPPAPAPAPLPSAPAPAASPAKIAAHSPAPAEPLDLEMGGPAPSAPAPSLFAADPGQSDKIRALLSDGDRACQQGEYQEAIDIWSRIFLIDIHNEAASKKIEDAKVLLAEQDRKIEELFNLAVSLLNQGKKDEARQKFDEVLSFEPHHLAARNYLRQLEEEKAGKDKAPASIPLEAPRAPEEVFLPPPQAMPMEEETPKSKKKLWLPALLAVVIIGLLFLGWRFLGGGAAAGRKNVDAAAAIAQAEVLYGQGRIADALAELGKIPLEDPLHNKAMQLIGDYRLGPKKNTKDTIDGRPAEVVAAEWRAQALQAYQNKDYTRAQELYNKSSQVRPLSLEDRAYLDDVNRTLEQIKTGQSSFDTGNFEQAIALLKPLYEKDRVVQARNILVNAYYNQGLTALKEEDLSKAEASFQEIVRIDDADQMTQKNLRLIKRYRDVNKDLLFKTYVKYLKPR